MNERIERLRGELGGLGAATFLVTNSVNVRYLTGFDSSNAALLVSGDRLVFAKGFETANIETGPVTPNTLFRIGKVTKMFTVAVLVTLAEERQIELRATIGKYFKGLNLKLSQIIRSARPWR